MCSVFNLTRAYIFMHILYFFMHVLICMLQDINFLVVLLVIFTKISFRHTLLKLFQTTVQSGKGKQIFITYLSNNSELQKSFTPN